MARLEIPSVFSGPPSPLITGLLQRDRIRQEAPLATGKAAMGPTDPGLSISSRIDVQDIRGDHGIPVDLNRADRAVDRYLTTGGFAFDR
jgi:hypothetical protein